MAWMRMALVRMASVRKAGPIWLAAGCVAAASLALGGCSGGSSQFAFGKAPPPTVADPTAFPTAYKTEVADFMRTYLSNPTKVKDATIGKPVLKPFDRATYYVTCVRYNPRDSQERYEGPTSNLVLFISGNLNQFLPPRPDICGGLTYERYPEIENMVP